MGAFCLFRRSPDLKRGLEQRLKKLFTQQGFCNFERVGGKEWTVLVYSKINGRKTALYRDGEDFAFSVGTLIYRSAMGQTALKLLMNDYRNHEIDEKNIIGHFSAGIHFKDNIRILIDRVGIYKVYHDTDRNIFSSSFLAVLDSINNVTCNVQSTYEYIFQGATYGGRTFIDQVEVLHTDMCIDLRKKAFSTNVSPVIINDTNINSFNDNVKDNVESLRSYAQILGALFGDNISCALTGGYDTRLLLAMLIEQGVSPKLHVYGNSNDLDVKLAKYIAKRENFDILHIDKSQFKHVTLDEFPDLIERNYLFFDTHTYAGVFDNGSDLQTRLDRVANGELYLNGGAGATFRNFFQLRNAQYSLRQFLWSFYCQFDPRVCTSKFSEQGYLDALARKIQDALGSRDEQLERNSIEALFQVFRSRFWMGRNVSLDNRFGWALTPFADYPVVKQALAVPIQQKSFGAFQSRLIRELNPVLATYPSVYNHNFSNNPPIRRVLSDLCTLLRPAIFRRYTYRIKKTFEKQIFPYYLKKEYVGSILDISFPYMSYFFYLDKLKDANHYNRICTLEYMFQKYNPSIN